VKYTISKQVFGDDTVYYIRLVGNHPFRNIQDRQAPFDIPHTRWLKGGVSPKSDWMKQRSYDGEKNLCNSEQKRWDEFLPVAHYIGSLMATEWFGRRWPTFRECRMIYRAGTRNAHAGPKFSSSTGVHEGSMTLSTWAIGANQGKCKEGGEAVVLHELAHAITPKQHEHSPLWARTYLELVKFRMGAAAGAMLVAGFKEKRVRYRPYRVVSPAQREALASRMRGLRARNSGQPDAEVHTMLAAAIGYAAENAPESVKQEFPR
jgi:putative metallohydrolase (TIGR04338 family)